MSVAPENLGKIVDSMAGKTVVVIGDIMLDSFIYGSTDRISPEAPVPVLLKSREKTMAGGAGNAAANLQALGVTTQVIALIGNDAHGQTVRDLLGSAAAGLIATDSRPTAIKTRYVAGHQQLLRVDEEISGDLDADLTAEIIKRAESLIPSADAVILSDYGKGVLSAAVIKAAIQAAQNAGIPVLVDPKKKDYSLYKGADIVTPNKKELSEATDGMAVNSDDEIIAASKALLSASGIKNVVATRSEKGMSLTLQDGDTVHYGATAQEVFDVSGAGDTVIATLAGALAAGADLEAAVALANEAGGVAVSYAGTTAVKAAALKDVLNKGAQTSFTANVRNWDDAAAQIKDWQSQGLKVGFTNGCFDIVHFGHVNYLAQARARCDKLVLGLNHDASVRILKGPERPLHDQDSRAAVIGALASIDMVVFFGAEQDGEDNTPSAALDAIRPDVIFKGGDYTIDQLPEAQVVLAYGGEVDIMPLYEGHSTTNTINKMKQTG